MRVLGGVALLEAGWIAISNFVPGARGKASPDGPGVIVAGPVERFAPGSVTPFVAGKCYLVRDEDGGFLALHRKCTHLGCSVPWNETERRFACPCHASAFDIHGDVVNAPASRPLDLFAVTIRDGVVRIDTSRPIRRTVFEPGQVVRA
ncbi:MAG: Rieske 2Fe-2S domain-containing protein [Gammaproteobacteria bacterium]|nr:Rieske 2Fe-2S domain-containing protein [Gammaproteobacteria bacterium]MBT8104789.1 Rieske 2Fe-2S domain-containing protein [Gammaproteobacteria bacterium]NNF50091.1 Rieske 2Fe-2S domain-containing protein [Woeseiaceae bacterium]NNK24803.1 Rieske 2Fe-2S domain-containing protein [Woeseiaceae bacterium]